MIRTITLNGISTDTLGAWVSEVEYGDLELKQIFEEIPFRDGYINFSKITGNQNFQPRNLSYTLAFRADTPDLLSQKIHAIRNWAYSTGDGYLIDGYYVGWRFVNVQRVNVNDPEYLNSARTHAKMRFEFICDPYLESITGTRSEIVQLAGRTITAYILANSVLCLGYTYPENPQMTVSIDGTTMTLTYDLPGADYAGLRCFDVSGTPDFTLTGGTLGGDPVTIAGAHNFYCDVPPYNYTLRLTATVAEGAVSPYIVLAVGAGIAFAHDDSRRYAIDDYAVGTHTLKVSGQTAAFAGFTLPNGDYDMLEIVGEREGVYDLRYDSVERTL
jgi:hypothetical protein